MSEWRRKLQDSDAIKDIAATSWQGYYWLSDEQEPRVVDGRYDPQYDSATQYIVEALLHDSADQSVHLVHDGQGYKITHYDLSLAPDGHTTEAIEYRAHRFDGHDILCFHEIWVPTPAPLCQSLPVNQLQATVFRGFTSSTQS